MPLIEPEHELIALCRRIFAENPDYERVSFATEIADWEAHADDYGRLLTSFTELEQERTDQAARIERYQAALKLALVDTKISGHTADFIRAALNEGASDD